MLEETLDPGSSAPREEFQGNFDRVVAESIYSQGPLERPISRRVSAAEQNDLDLARAIVTAIRSSRMCGEAGAESQNVRVRFSNLLTNAAMVVHRSPHTASNPDTRACNHKDAGANG